MEAAELKGNSDRTPAYWNTYFCMTDVISQNGRMYTKYCKNRFCTVCCAIRKADIVNRYYPVISKWKEPYFVTLTLAAVPASQLPRRMREMFRVFRLIKDEYKKKAQRGKDIKLMGIKSFECNFNPLKHTYNPHFHIIVPDARNSIILRREWNRRWGSKQACRLHQHEAKIKNLTTCLIEIIKYSGKIFTQPDMKNDGTSRLPPMIYAAALDYIFASMKGLRIFDRFGFNLSRSNHRPRYAPKQLRQAQKWKYDPIVSDWVNHSTGEVLTGFVPSQKLTYLLKHNVDLMLM